MEERINVAELLKDCPEGMELDSPVWDNIVFEKNDINNIVIHRKSTNSKVYLSQYGAVNSIDGKCVIFPKGKTTWEGFQRPFKDGDILATDLGSVFYLNTRLNTDERYGCYVGIGGDGSFHICIPFAYKECCGFASEEEKQKLFKAIKDNGYKWNDETKTLEKLITPKFKVGDRIRKENNNSRVYTINGVYSSMYGAEGRDFGILIEEQDEWELVTNKFDINTLVPFESRVLVRDDGYSLWQPCLWGLYDNEHRFPYIATGGRYRYCIPFKGNEHLLGTTDDCDEYYKTWE